ncbi:MAG: DUF418 domain-containing protein [Pseudomonadota bacterium]
MPLTRIESLDLLRGIAVLGILLLNINSFALPLAAYSNPMAYGGYEGADLQTWYWVHIFAEAKFFTLFSILFGAGICLFFERAEAKELAATHLHFRRMIWLLVFGMIHAYAIWYGDILVAYAVCGLWAYRNRHSTPLSLIVWSIAFLLLGCLMAIFTGLGLAHLSESELIELQHFWLPSADSVEIELAAMRGSWIDQMPMRAETALMFQTSMLVLSTFWRTLALMYLGIMLYRLGFLALSWNTRSYLLCAVISGVVGFTLITIGANAHISHEFSFEYSMGVGTLYNYFGSVLVAICYAALTMLWAQSGRFEWLQKNLRAVGRTAFTNYIAQSIVCTSIFYGHGLGWFGTLSRAELLVVVVLVWILQLSWSKWWLSHYPQGPLENVWRRLTYSNHAQLF